MNTLFFLATLLVSTTLISLAESQIIIGTAIAAIIALKIVAKAGFIAGAAIGSRRGGSSSSRGSSGRGGRWGRSPLEIDEVILGTSLEDSQDCAKKLVCLVNASPFDSLNEQEKSIYTLFGGDSLDVSKDSIEFELAAVMGRKVGARQCNKIYARCPHQKDAMDEIIRQQFNVAVQ